MKFHGHLLEGGILKFTGKDAWVRMQLSALKPGEITIDVRPYVHRRTINQNAYYWAVLVPIVLQGLRDMGFDEIRDQDDAHGFLKEMFFKVPIYSEHQDTLYIIRSTTKFSKKEFSEKIDQIIRWAFEFLGITIPPPNSQAALDMQ